MFDASWPGWTLAQSVITASAGLLGVISGAVLTSRNQSKERKHAHIREQLQGFYSPMLGMREEIAAKTTFQDGINVQVAEIIKKAKAEYPGGERKTYNKDEVQALSKLRKYDYAQWEEEVFPLYKRMLKLFADKMWLAEDSTRAHYGDLTNYVEKWNRFDALTTTAELAWEMNFSDDDKVKEFFRDVEENFKRLQKLLGR